MRITNPLTDFPRDGVPEQSLHFRSSADFSSLPALLPLVAPGGLLPRSLLAVKWGVVSMACFSLRSLVLSHGDIGRGAPTSARAPNASFLARREELRARTNLTLLNKKGDVLCLPVNEKNL